jgi:hypothetical protein
MPLAEMLIILLAALIAIGGVLVLCWPGGRRRL